jgi:nicotinamidase-related amidase
LKPKHSAFFSTVLDTLLTYLKARRLILAGFAADQCVLMSAVDAYLRDFEIYVPSDCVASATQADNAAALRYMARVLHADTSSTTKLDLRKLARRPTRRAKGRA